MATLIAIPVLDRIVYPGFRRLGFNLTPLRRMVAGYFCGVVSVILAGVIEIARKEVIKRDGTITQNVFGRSVNASSMSVFYQVPQYFLNGMSEALAVVTSRLTCFQLFANQIKFKRKLKRRVLQA